MKNIKEIALSTPDPERAAKNLNSLIKGDPEIFESLSEEELCNTSMLFSCSQFLANYCIRNPLFLQDALKKMDKPLEKESIQSAIDDKLTIMNQGQAQHGKNDILPVLREFKKRSLLQITLRTILRKTDTSESMTELSLLADVLIEKAYTSAKKELTLRYGDPVKDAFSIIALGKLGAEELNYSSDIDIICVYGNDKGETSGILRPHGVRMNRISNHEFYCKLVESITKSLSLNTQDGFAYRVDLRLRPEGQKGELALSLGGYELYYESWGREWERIALIRARHVAGDGNLGREFMDTVRPFVYRKYLDMGAIEEIRRLKTKIDATFKENDIKRGYGGIREIEFFTQTLQLIYGGKDQLLRENKLPIALHRLQQKNLIGYDDYSILSRNYLYLRKLEHFLQMLDDLRTHKIPRDEQKLMSLAKKMEYKDKEMFIHDLERRRLGVRKIYDSLFKPPTSRKTTEGSILFDRDITEKELKEYLRTGNIKDLDKVVYSIQKIRDSMNAFQSLKGKRLQDSILPEFTEEALKTENPDRTLNNFQRFADIIITNEPYLEVFDTQKKLIKALVEIFSKSEHLSSIIMGSPRYLDMLSEGTPLRKTLRVMMDELRSTLKEKVSFSETLSIFRKMEEVRLGIMFLNKKISIFYLMKGLTKVAEAILTSSLENLTSSNNLVIIGFGKFGGREITINSDLDITFISRHTPDYEENKVAERVLRVLMSYTKEGIVYKADTRLRPEGSKGPLINSFEAITKYYMNKARLWEIQALLRARPITGDKRIRDSFLTLARKVIHRRGGEVLSGDIIQMRERIKKELAKESAAFDIKLGSGGIEDIEFLVQYLQLINASHFPALLTQSTMIAFKRLMTHHILDMETGKKLLNNYLFYRTVETFVRLRGEDAIVQRADLLESLSVFLDFKDVDDFQYHLKNRMVETKTIVDRMMN